MMIAARAGALAATVVELVAAAVVVLEAIADVAAAMMTILPLHPGVLRETSLKIATRNSSKLQRRPPPPASSKHGEPAKSLVDLKVKESVFSLQPSVPPVSMVPSAATTPNITALVTLLKQLLVVWPVTV